MENVQEAPLSRNIARVLSANLWVAMIGFIGSFIFSQILSIESYALYHTFTLYISYITILPLGFPSGMVINYAGKNYENIDEKQYRSEILILFIILGIFVILFFLLFLVSMDKMIAYIAIAIVPTGIVGSYKSLLQAWSRFKTFSRISTMITTFIPVTALFYYMVSKELPGDIYIKIYLGVYWIIAIVIIFEIMEKIRGVKAKKLISSANWQTEKTGAALVFGNYMNTIFMSSDKLFVKWYFGTTEFAYYSFGMSMQVLMTVFITSIAQPLFPAMAQGKFKDKDFNGVKELLLVFGSFSGCAYFATSMVVKVFIHKYIRSLDVVGIYFVVFPALAVINCLYINLYKIKGLMRTYINTLVVILLIAIILNVLFICCVGGYRGVAIATTVTYYIWFAIGLKQFKFIEVKTKDILYLLLYFIGFFTITRIKNNFVGFVVYCLYICIIALLCYRQSIMIYVARFKFRRKL